MNTKPTPPSPIGLVLFFIATAFLVPKVCAQKYAPVIEPNHRIVIASRAGKNEEVFEELNKGVSVNSCDIFGQNPLRNALETGHLDLARQLLQRGFQPTLLYQSQGTGAFIEIGRGALYYAAKAGAEDIVDELLKRGLQAYPILFAAENTPGDPVLGAVQGNQPSILRKLLESVSPDVIRAHLKENGYEYLAACNITGTLDVLLAYDVDVNILDSHNLRPSVLHTYARRGWKEGILKVLEKDADPTVRQRDDQLPEEVAASIELKNLLATAALRHHIELKPTGKLQTTYDGEKLATDYRKSHFNFLVMEAAFNRSETSAIELLKNSDVANLNEVDDRNWSLLNYALHYRYIGLAAELIKAGIDLQHLTKAGSTIIGFAVSTRNTAVVEQLIAKGIEIDAPGTDNWTALLTAIEAGDVPMMELLLAHGAAIEPPRPEGPNGKWRNALMVAAKAGNILMMDRLLKAGSDLNAVDSSGENVIFYAVRSTNVEALTWLVNHGAYPQLKTPRGTNALTLAAYLGNLPMVKALIDLGLKHPDALNYARSSPNDSVATQKYLNELKKQANPDDPADLWNRYEISTGEVKQYIAAGRDVNYATGCPTPLQQMAMQGNAESVALLLEKGADPRKRGHMANSAVFNTMYIHPGTDEDRALATLRVFISHGVSPNSREYLFGLLPPEKEASGNTLLCFAISQGYLKCARYLLDQGADPSLSSASEDAFDKLNKVKSITEVEREEFAETMEAAAARIVAANQSSQVHAPEKKASF